MHEFKSSAFDPLYLTLARGPQHCRWTVSKMTYVYICLFGSQPLLLKDINIYKMPTLDTIEKSDIIKCT